LSVAGGTADLIDTASRSTLLFDEPEQFVHLLAQWKECKLHARQCTRGFVPFPSVDECAREGWG
jgi:hypothetical protein